MTIEIRHLRYFASIVAHGNISRAAAALHLSQPALSRALAQLEHRLGVELVDRSTHHLAVTEAGRLFAMAARDAVHAFDQAIASVGTVVAPLRFGHSWSGATHAAAIVRAWRNDRPGRVIVSRRSDERLAGLAAGEVDVALVRGVIDDPTLRSEILDHEARMAALPSTHRLAGAAQVALADLATETLVVNTLSGTTTLDLWPGPDRPTIGSDERTIDDWLIAIATSVGVGITAASTVTLHPHPDVRFVPIADAPALSVSLVWPRRGAHPDIRSFIAVARRAVASAR